MADSSIEEPSADAGCVAFGCGQPDVAFLPCPVTAPTSGAACDVEGEDCEYGASWWLVCDLLLRCTGGHWVTPPNGASCGWLDAGGTCPATFAAASAFDGGIECPAPDCQYPEGYCECLVGCGGGGQLPRPELAGRWACMEASAGCPSPRPRLGTSCEAGTGCGYGWPCGCGQSQSCVDGVWQGSPTPVCP